MKLAIHTQGHPLFGAFDYDSGEQQFILLVGRAHLAQALKELGNNVLVNWGSDIFHRDIIDELLITDFFGPSIIHTQSSDVIKAVWEMVNAGDFDGANVLVIRPDHSSTPRYSQRPTVNQEGTFSLAVYPWDIFDCAIKDNYEIRG